MRNRLVSVCVLLIVLSGRLYAGEIIRAQDALDIRVHAHPEFSGVYSVSAAGTITHPALVGETVVNLSIAELSATLTFKLARYIDNPVITITRVENPQITVTVLGSVQKPGPVVTYDNVTVQEVLFGAGGTTADADLEKIRVIRSRASGSGELFDLASFRKSGEVGSMPRLRDKDIVVVLAESENRKVKVIGAVNRPGFFDLTTPMNVFELIYMAGGPADKADLSRVRRFFVSSGKTMEEALDIQKYLDKGAMDDIPMVAPGDVVIVYSRWFDWRTLLTIMNNVLLFIVTFKTFGGVFG